MHVVYKFICHGCDAQYIGQTKRHLRTSVAEHKQRWRESAVKDHCWIWDRREKQIDVAEFEIMKNGFSSRSLRRYYEAITIKKSSIEILNTRSKKKAEELFLFIS